MVVMLIVFMVIILIASILALIFILRCLILLFAYDYEMWKRKKEDKNHCHQVEDNFKNHKLDEWHDFCDWIKTLPYSELITGEE